jgi:hypothetical protein
MADNFTPGEVGELLGGAHRKPEPERLPRPLGSAQSQAAYNAVGEAIRALDQLGVHLADGGCTDAAFAAAVAAIVVPLEHAAREACHD